MNNLNCLSNNNDTTKLTTPQCNIAISLIIRKVKHDNNYEHHYEHNQIFVLIILPLNLLLRHLFLSHDLVIVDDDDVVFVVVVLLLLTLPHRSHKLHAHDFKEGVRMRRGVRKEENKRGGRLRTRLCGSESGKRWHSVQGRKGRRGGKSGA